MLAPTHMIQGAVSLLCLGIAVGSLRSSQLYVSCCLSIDLRCCYYKKLGTPVAVLTLRCGRKSVVSVTQSLPMPVCSLLPFIVTVCALRLSKLTAVTMAVAFNDLCWSRLGDGSTFATFMLPMLQV